MAVAKKRLKKKKQDKKEKKEIFYVSVNDPITLRKSILEASKDLIQALQKYEKLKEVRKTKKELIAVLKEDVREISGMISNLKKSLPTTGIKETPTLPGMKKKEKKEEPKKEMPLKEEPKVPEKKVEKKKPHKRALTEIEKLENELNKIEAKLGTLA